MRKAIISALAACSLLTAAACETTAGPGEFGANKTTAGTVLGAVGGGLAGSTIGKGRGSKIATGVGVLIGAALGHSIGSSLDRADLALAQQAEARAYNAPIGQAITWENPDTGNYGSYTPRRDGRTANGELCREYQTTVTIGGRTEEAIGTACQSSDGTWHIQN